MRGGGRLKLEERLSRDNEAAHECRNEWVLFTIANSGPSGLAGQHPSRRLIHVASQPTRTTTNAAGGESEISRETPPSRPPVVYPDF